MARRFVINKSINFDDEFEIDGDEAKHIMILRHDVGDEIIVNDKVCEIKHVSKQKILCKAIRQAEKIGVPSTKITLFQALLKSDKMEYVIQKSVEIGAYKIVPFISKNVVVKLEDKDKSKKSERWRKIAIEASKQCGRSDIVEIDDICLFSDIFNMIKEYDLAIVAYEKNTNSLKKVIRENMDCKNIAIIIGAEGGFDEGEMDKISNIENVKLVSLGERILRAETASVNLLSILIYEFDM